MTDEQPVYVMYQGELCVVTRIATETTYWLDPVDNQFGLGPYVATASEVEAVPTIEREGE